MDRREAILDAAGKLIIRWGFKKTTIEDIAQACDLERASVYYYFKNKDEILAEVVRREVDRQSAILFEAQNREATAPGKLRALFRGHLEAFATSEIANIGGESRTNVIQVLPQAFQLLHARREKFTGLINDIIELGIKSGELRAMDARQTADGIRTFILGHAMGHFLGDLPPRDALIGVFDALVRGLETEAN